MPTPAMAPDSIRSLLARLQDARSRSDALFRVVAPDSLYDRPIPERHRLIFYFGHLEAFDWNLLGRRTFDLPSDNPELDELLAFGIDPTHGDLPTDAPADWPRPSQILEYNEGVRRRIDERLEGAVRQKNPPPSVADGMLLHVAIEHRLMHLETLAYLLHELPFNQKNAQGAPKSMPAVALKARMVRVPSGVATLGQPRPNGGMQPDTVRRYNLQEFGWDNEFETLCLEVPELGISAFPVTNGEYLEFVRAGGYDDGSLWHPEDWGWKEAQGTNHPRFWIRRGDCWLYRAMFGEIPLPLDWPVYVSQAEASAYARWVGKSLPTEAQWHRAAYGTGGGSERLYPWGNEPPESSRGNFNFAGWEPASVASHPAGASAFGVYDLLGNGWEWTSTPFAPFPGFAPFEFYPGYSADFFDGRHFVLKGGSARTALCFLRRTFRNWFQPRYPYVYATFRCVET